jgi:secreted trypsin-like serine protease
MMSKHASKFCVTFSRILLVTSLLGACSGSPELIPIEIDETSREIIDGELATRDPSVVLSLARIGPGRTRLCTASVITPKILLLAAHCVAKADLADATFSIALANNLEEVRSGRAPLIPVQTRVPHPRYTGDSADGRDFGLLVMAAPLALKPLPLNRTPTVTGEPVRYVGFGISDKEEAAARAMGMTSTMNTSGTKRQASATLGPLEPGSDVIVTVLNPENNVCSGDSGGPLFVKRDGIEVIAGVASFTRATCQGRAAYGLVDKEIDWIDEQIQKFDPQNAPPVRDGGAGSDATMGPGGSAGGGGSGSSPDAGAPQLPPNSGAVPGASAPPPPPPAPAPLPPTNPGMGMAPMMGAGNVGTPVSPPVEGGGCSLGGGRSRPGFGTLAIALGLASLGWRRRRPRE